jgi:hypothetical protein
MATTYICEICHKTTQDITDWYIVSVQFVHTNPMTPYPPGGRTQQAIAPDLVFDTLTCRSAWCQKAGVDDPGPVPATMRRTTPLEFGGPQGSA